MRISMINLSKTEPDRSYITNCIIAIRDDETADCLIRDTGDGKVILKLDGYAIIPRERFLVLAKLQAAWEKEHPESAYVPPKVYDATNDPDVVEHFHSLLFGEGDQFITVRTDG